MRLTILVQIGLFKAPDLPNVPLLMDLAKNEEDRAVLKLLSASTTIGRPIFTTPGVPLTALYKFERERTGLQVVRYTSFTNSEPAKLGKEPLPDGRVQAFRLDTPDRLMTYVGATAVKYIPINEKVELELGADQNVLVKPTLMNWEKTNLAFDQNGNVKGWTTKETWKIELQNSRDIDVTVDVRRNFSGDWTLTTTATNEKVDANKVKFLVPLKPREKRELTYDLTTRLGSNATR